MCRSSPWPVATAPGSRRTQGRLFRYARSSTDRGTHRHHSLLQVTGSPETQQPLWVDCGLPCPSRLLTLRPKSTCPPLHCRTAPLRSSLPKPSVPLPWTSCRSRSALSAWSPPVAPPPGSHICSAYSIRGTDAVRSKDAQPYHLMHRDAPEDHPACERRHAAGGWPIRRLKARANAASDW